MTDSYSNCCLVCKEQKRKDFSCLFKNNGQELSEVGLLFQELLQIVIYVNTAGVYLCSNCSLHLKQFHEFKKKSTEAYSNLLQIIDVNQEPAADSTTFENGQICSSSLSASSQGDIIPVRVEEVSVFNANSSETEQFQIKYIEDDSESDEQQPVVNNSDDLENLLQQSDLHLVYVIPEDHHKCDHCEEVFETEEALTEHKQLHIEPRQCEFCTELFWDEKQYRSHLYCHIKTCKTYQCHKCPQRYLDKKHIVEHITDHVFGLKCEKCGKMFYRKNLLQVHLRITHAAERRYLCRTCGKRFKSSSHLRNHHYTHKGKQFQCPTCPNRYSTPRTLRDHFKSIHGRDLTDSCEICEQLFIYREDLLVHIREQHGVTDVNDPIEFVFDEI